MRLVIAAFSTLLLLAISAGHAQTPSSAVGRWKTIDDVTGKAKSVVEVYMAKDGRLAGIISIGDVVKRRIEEVQLEAAQIREYIATA